jgi:ribosome production factor 1
MVLPSEIKNKVKREQVYNKQRQEKAQEKLKRRLALKKAEEDNPELKKERLSANVTKTLENTREFDETIVNLEGGEGGNEVDEETMMNEEMDEFKAYFTDGLTPKILVTTSRRAGPVMHATIFCLL